VIERLSERSIERDLHWNSGSTDMQMSNSQQFNQRSNPIRVDQLFHVTLSHARTHIRLIIS